MKKGIIIIYASVDGHTKKICEYIKHYLAENQESVTISDIENMILKDDEVFNFDKIVIASSIRYGKHHPKIENFIQKYSEALNRKKAVFVSVNLVARKPEKSSPETNPYVLKFLQAIRWKPNHVAVFAGKLNYKMYPFWDRILIQLIMLITKGPTDSKTEIEYTNWGEVKDFAKKIAVM